MSILNTFYILFKSNADELKKGAESALKTIKKTEKGLKGVSKASDKVGGQFLSLMNSAAKIGAAFYSASSIYSHFQNTLANVSEISKVSRELNVNVELLDAWGEAVTKGGGSAQEFQSSLRSLYKTLNTTPQTALETLPTIADALSRMNNVQARIYGQSLGLDMHTILLLQRGRVAVKELVEHQKELGVTTRRDAADMLKFKSELHDLNRVYMNLERSFAMPFLEPLGRFVENLTDKMDGFASKISKVATELSNLTEFAYKLNPLVLAGVIKEDISTWQSGGNSAVGWVHEDMKALWKRIGNAVPIPSLPQLFGGNNQSQNVTIGEVKVMTQATDAQGIARDIEPALQKQLEQANGYFDNGVAR